MNCSLLTAVHSCVSGPRLAPRLENLPPSQAGSNYFLSPCIFYSLLTVTFNSLNKLTVVNKTKLIHLFVRHKLPQQMP